MDSPNPDRPRPTTRRERDLIDAARLEAQGAPPADPQPTVSRPDSPERLVGYEITRQLGRGGMGVVYLAHDTTLDRPVAIKTLPPAFTRSTELLNRFQREARLLASLSHPNIATVHAFIEHEQARFLVMEYIDGQTLSARLLGGALSVDEALSIAAQIATGLDAAHEAGVIHRDLKPANVMLTDRGQVKVLDFGLARSTVPKAHASDGAEWVTQERTVLGTAGYMSPEQARGKPVDKRTDIWSFGCVLYELLTGRRTFDAPTGTDIIARILERDPDWSILPERTPLRVVELLQRCLTKDPARRLRDVGDARMEIETALERREWSSADDRRPDLTRSNGEAPPPPVVRVSVRVPQPLDMSISRGDARPLLTADGSTLVYVAPERSAAGARGTRHVYRRRLDEPEPVLIPGTEHACVATLSCDGRSVAFVAFNEAANERPTLNRVPLDGGAPPTLLHVFESAPSLGLEAMTWLPNGDFIFAESLSTRRVFRLPGDGASPLQAIDLIHEHDYGQIHLGPPLPGGHAIWITLVGNASGADDCAVLDLTTGRSRSLIAGAYPACTASGHLVFSRGASLLAAALDLQRQQVCGAPVTIIKNARTLRDWLHAPFALSSGGTLAYIRGGVLGGQRCLSILGPGASIVPWSADRRALVQRSTFVPSTRSDLPRLVGVVQNPEGNWEVWGSELNRPRLRPLVRTPAHDIFWPIMSPDGATIAFTARTSSLDWHIGVRPFDLSADIRTIVPPRENAFARTRAWTPDGRAIVYSLEEQGRRDLMLAWVETARDQHPTPTRLIPGDASTEYAAFSPDGKLLAYATDESGNWEAVVRAWRPDGLGPPVDVSTHGGTTPKWSRTPGGCISVRWMVARFSALRSAPLLPSRSRRLFALRTCRTPIRARSSGFSTGYRFPTASFWSC